MKATYTPLGGSAYNHDDRDVMVTSYEGRFEFDDSVVPAGAYRGWTQSAGIEFTVYATTQVALAAKMLEAERAYGLAPLAGGGYRSAQGGTLVFLHADGSTALHAIDPTRTAGASRVRSFAWKPGEGVEYATQRTAVVQFTNGILPPGGDANAPNQVTVVYNEGTQQEWNGGGPGSESSSSYVEEYSAEGGDPTYGTIALPFGAPYQYLVNQRSVLRERHTITITTVGSFAPPPGTFLQAPWKFTQRKQRERRSPNKHTATYTYSRES
jgi:hypothetical protein